jgi:hypothetical protein
VLKRGRRWGSPVSTVSEYGLDDRATKVLSPVDARKFSPNLWGLPSLVSNGYRGYFAGSKARPGRDADHPLPSSAGTRMSRGYKLSPLVACMAVAVQLYFYFTLPKSGQFKQKPLSDGSHIFGSLASTWFRPNVAADWLANLLHIREVPDSKLDSEDRLSWPTFLCDFPQTLLKIQG